jgi:hypothetical protein
MHRVTYFWGHARDPCSSASFVDHSLVAPVTLVTAEEKKVVAIEEVAAREAAIHDEYAMSIPDVKNIDPAWPIALRQGRSSVVMPEFMRCPSPFLNEPPPGKAANCGWLIDDRSVSNEQTAQVFTIADVSPGDELFLGYGPCYGARGYPVGTTDMVLIGYDRDTDEYCVDYTVHETESGHIEFVRPSAGVGERRATRTEVETHFMALS